MRNLNRYCGRLLYVYDYAIGRKRTEAECTKEEALKAIRELFTLQQKSKEIKHMFDKEADRCRGITVKMIADFSHWGPAEVYKYYNNNRRETEAAAELKRQFIGKYTLDEIADVLDVDKWVYANWTRCREKIPWNLVKTIEKFGGQEFTPEELKAEWRNTIDENLTTN